MIETMYIGSGDVHALMSGKDSQSHLSLLRRFVSGIKPHYNALGSPIDALRTGAILENRYLLTLPDNYFAQYTCICAEMSVFKCSLDFAKIEDGRVVDFDELKTVYLSDYLEFESLKEDLEALLPFIENKYKHYYYQVQEQLLCTGLQECNLVFLSVTSYNDEENLTRVIQPNVLSLPPFYFVFMKYYLPLKTPLNSTTMYAEKTQKESPSRTIQTKPGGGRVYMEDNRPEAVRQTEFINTIQLKEKNQLYPIIQRTKITTSISQSSSESSLDGVRDLEKKEDVNELLSDLVIEVRYSADVIGKALRSKIAISLDHPDATWDELFKGYLTAEDRKVMTKVWKKWFYEPVPWDVGDEEKGKEKEEEKKEEEKKPSPYKGEKISPFTRRHQKGEFVGNPEAIHIHIVVTRLI